MSLLLNNEVKDENLIFLNNFRNYNNDLYVSTLLSLGDKD